MKKLIICLGGSATNDGGAGLAQALGVKFLDAGCQEIERGGGNLPKIDIIDISGLMALPADLVVEVACDVNNPLTGISGATYIYGPQKGATPDMINLLDQGLEHYAAKIKACVGKEVKNIPGAGAAGGAGAGLLAFLNASLIKGIDLVIKHVALEEKILKADFVFTGEGSIDSQTANGKAISGVLALGIKHQKPVIAFAGKVADTEALYDSGLTAVLGITQGVLPLDEALKNGSKNLEQATRAAVGLIVSAAKRNEWHYL